MSKSHYEVVKGFKNGKEYKGHNVYALNGVLYSYGSHFPLAVKRGEEPNTWFLLNGDKYSSSTSGHQSLTHITFNDSPRTSFNALRAAGLNYHTVNLIDFTRDSYHCASSDDADFNDFKVPIGAEYHESKKDGEVTYKSYHRIGCVLLENEGKYYLCGMDEGSYFISLLPEAVKTVDEAFNSLKPELVKEAEWWECDIYRQGEWFFIPSAIKIKEKDFQKKAALPSADSSSNRHIATRLCMVSNTKLLMVSNIFYVKGTIRHKNSFGGRADHKMLRLPKGIYQAVINTAKGNWSASGRVD